MIATQPGEESIKVALAALSGERTIAELCSEFGVHQTLIHKWVKQFKESAAGVFFRRNQDGRSQEKKELYELQAKISQLIVERDFLAKAWGKR